MATEHRMPDPQSEIERYRSENLQLKRQLGEHKQRAEELLASTSWRITAPVRALAAWVKHLGAIGRRGAQRRPGEGLHSIPTDQYRGWLRSYGTIDRETRAAMEASIAGFASRPLISVLMPNYNIEFKWLREAIQSVRNQIYPHFELCISDDASSVSGMREFLQAQASQEKRIRLTFRDINGHISANSNSALALATGDYVALMDADDLISPDALYWVAHAIASHPDVDLLFSDEDKIDEDGERFDPYFKSAWNPALMLAQNAFSHLGVFRRSLIEKVGGFREGFEGAQDHDLVLRCAEVTTPKRIRHIPRVLYHWRALPDSTSVNGHSKPYAWDAGRRAIEQHLQRQGIAGSVEPVLAGYYQVAYPLPARQPLVSIALITDLHDGAMQVLKSILDNTAYGNFEIIVVTRERDGGAAFSDPRLRMLTPDVAASTRGAYVNAAAAAARGSVLCLLDDDIEPVSRDWLDQLVARTELPGVGIAGPMVCGASGKLLHAGMIVGAGGAAGYPFRNSDCGSPGYMGRAAVEQDYTCLSSACMAISLKAFHAAGGFDPALPAPLDAIDFCLRVRNAGLRAIWVPTARMRRRPSDCDEPPLPAVPEAMRQRWSRVMDDDPCYSSNLTLDPERLFQLDVPARLGLPRGLSPGALVAVNSSRSQSSAQL